MDTYVLASDRRRMRCVPWLVDRGSLPIQWWVVFLYTIDLSVHLFSHHFV